MSDTHTYSSDVAFTPAVKAIQTRKGSREGYARVEQHGGWRTEIDEKLAGFLANTNSFYMATATKDGQPYIQHRGGPKGFIKILDKNTIAFTDYSGNQQYLTQGNLSENPKAHIFIMDYAHRRRVKLWGEARVVDNDPALLQALMPKGYRARPEQVIVFKITAWDTNCPQHIPQKFDAADVAAALAARHERIAALEKQICDRGGSPQRERETAHVLGLGAHPDNLIAADALAFIRFIQAAGSQPTVEDLAAYEAAKANPPEENPPAAALPQPSTEG